MNRSTLIILLILTILSFTGQNAEAHNDSITHGLSQHDLESYLRQSEQLVSFLEFAFNTLGDPEISPREKDIIINQSYLKFFVSDKVQIEDDLVEGRFTVTNKDVQAYLKDIDFFFTEVVFTFNIEDVSYNVNDEGQIFFIVTTTRNLSGISVEGDTVFNNQERFIEINLDRNKKDLKIASIYTAKLTEKEDMRNWWSALGSDWRLFFAKGTMISDVYPLKDIHDFDNDWMLIERLGVIEVEGYIMETRRVDTLYENAAQVYSEIAKFWKTESIDISTHRYMTDLSALSKLRELKSINISGTYAGDLTPLRNLTRLENLDVSGSEVKELDVLRYTIKLTSLDISSTAIFDLTPLQAFPVLERLNVSNTPVADTEPLASLHSLLDLRLSNTEVYDLAPLKNLHNLIVLDISGTQVTRLDSIGNLQSLSRLHADNTGIGDLGPLKGLQNLQYVFLEGTQISSLEPLSGLPALKRIYCDRTGITHEKAGSFMQSNPGVLVIYESQALTSWWQAMPQAWKEVFRSIQKLSDIPTREELHELAKITDIDISGNSNILNLGPLQKLLSLRNLNASETGIISVEPLAENIDLVELNISSTLVHDITALSSLSILETLKMSYTPVSDLSPLRNNRQLKHLDIDYTNVESISPLAAGANLELLICDGIEADPEEVDLIYSSHPKVTVIYQTPKLTAWFSDLPDSWVSIFSSHAKLGSPPTRLQLQKLVDIKELDISDSRSLSNLSPLVFFHRLEILRMNNLNISDISPIKNLSNLRELYCSDNPISNIKTIRYLSSLEVLDISNTLVRKLHDLNSLHNLRILNVAGTQIRNLRPLNEMFSLEQLDCFNTGIRSLRPLENLKNLELLRCYNTRLWPRSIKRFSRAVPDCEVIYY